MTETLLRLLTALATSRPNIDFSEGRWVWYEVDFDLGLVVFATRSCSAARRLPPIH